MNNQVAAIARSVLYEGYILWPYRRSALKNQRRWTFGGVYPSAHTDTGHPDDACMMRTECLLEAAGALDLHVAVRFLHVVDRRLQESNEGRFVDSLTVRGVSHVAWQEAVEREITVRLPRIDLRRHIRRACPVEIEPDVTREPLIDERDHIAGWIVRTWQAIAASVEVRVAPLATGTARISVEVRNNSFWGGGSRDDVQRRTLVATHTILHASSGQFVSSIDPPPSLAHHVADCRNIGTWPVLVGKSPARDTMLSSPIILYDYPEVAPESSGDFFDAAEIDQLLVLGVLSMTEEEQARMAETDPRAREILERCRSMTADDLLRLHGATRQMRTVEEAR